MQAFYSFWTKPNTARNQGAVELPDFELLSAILSALEWKKLNGPVRMITDTPGAEYFKRLGIDSVWDHMDVTLDEIGNDIDPFLFWAAGKLYALKSMETPCAMIDTDLIIWKNLSQIADKSIVAAHAEELNPFVYPDPESFGLKEGYQFPKEWDYQVKAANTAFLYIRDREFRDLYVEQAMEIFQKLSIVGLNPVTAMCFAEQRVLPMCAAAEKIPVDYLLDQDHLDEQEIATHTWGFKQVLREVPEAREEFCMRCIKRIAQEFPEKMVFLKNCVVLEKYYEQYKQFL